VVSSRDLLHGEITEKIIGAFYQVVYELGVGFLESVYERAMVLLLRELGLKAERQVRILVYFRGTVVGDYRADLLVEGVVIVEFKVARIIDPAHEAQFHNHLHACPVEVGLLLRIDEKPEVRRVILTNDRKHHLAGAGPWATVLAERGSE
jgi:GxxExxY protein